MKKDIVILSMVGLLIFGFVIGAFAEDLVWDNIGKEISEVNTVLVDRLNPKYIYIGTHRGVYRSEDGGDTWRAVTNLNKNINFLLPDNQGMIYAATVNGLFFSQDSGRKWQRVFRGKNSDENNCLTLAILKPDLIYLGTGSGLFISRDRGKTWHKPSGELGNISISSIAVDSKDNVVYLVGTNKVFKIQDGLDYYREIFTKGLKSIDQSEAAEEENIDELTVNPKISYVAIDPNIPNRVYLASDSGAYLSQDEGLTWNLISNFGMLSKEVKFILLSRSSDLYAITNSGIFLYKNARWQELSLRLIAQDIRFLAIDNQNNLYAVTHKGIFRAEQNSLSASLEDAPEYFKNEPTVGELHQAAIKYAQVVDPQRIEDLRKQARLKAVLPELSMDYDRTITSYSNTSTTRFTVGPADWGFSLKWSLSDLIWSEQQRLIDSQVRLMIELRNDILDEVNKIYFERRKVKMELAQLSYQDSKKISEKKLRLEELTASLDALTGGYFSHHLK